MAENQGESIAINTEPDLVVVRQVVRERAKELGFSLIDQTKLVTAASELARNALMYGGGGTCTVKAVRNSPSVGLRLVFEDRGEGIAQVAEAMSDGYSTGGGLGLGLGGARRLVNEFDIVSRPGEGTRVTITRWK